MDATHYFLAVLSAGVVYSFTDWFFGGILFHDKYLAYPEVWRQTGGRSETPAVAWSVVLGFLTAAAFMGVSVTFAVHGYGALLRLAGLCWLMVPVPLLITNALFIKIQPLTVLSHALGWLAKLAIAAIIAAWLLP